MNRLALKLLAVTSMMIDHLGAIFFPQYLILRIIGRLAFPIFCFFLVEGYLKTANFKKYLGRLMVFAFISEVPFDLAFFGKFPMDEHNNVFFTLAIGLLVLYFIDYFRKKDRLILGVIPISLCCFFAELLNTDYGAMGILIIVSFYFMRSFDEKSVKFLALAVFCALNIGKVQSYAILALIPIYFYNDKRGFGLKYLFYSLYPLHLALFALIQYVQGLGTL